MKRLPPLIAGLLSLAAFTSQAQLPPTPGCVTNLTITPMNGATLIPYNINGSTCFTNSQVYTNTISCPELIGYGCNQGTTIRVVLPTCPNVATIAAVVVWQNNQGVICGNSEGGPMNCPVGSSMTIVIPAGQIGVTVSIYQGWWQGCGQLTSCQFDGVPCNYSGGPPPRD